MSRLSFRITRCREGKSQKWERPIIRDQTVWVETVRLGRMLRGDLDPDSCNGQGAQKSGVTTRIPVGSDSELKGTESAVIDRTRFSKNSALSATLHFKAPSHSELLSAPASRITLPSPLPHHPVKYKYAPRMSSNTTAEATTSLALQLALDCLRSSWVRVAYVRPLILSELGTSVK